MLMGIKILFLLVKMVYIADSHVASKPSIIWTVLHACTNGFASQSDFMCVQQRSSEVRLWL
eukprot:SAG31_NODE_2111_length_6426_cov_4.423295_4_plen_61_part_00